MNVVEEPTDWNDDHPAELVAELRRRAELARPVARWLRRLVGL